MRARLPGRDALPSRILQLPGTEPDRIRLHVHREGRLREPGVRAESCERAADLHAELQPGRAVSRRLRLFRMERARAMFPRRGMRVHLERHGISRHRIVAMAARAPAPKSINAATVAAERAMSTILRMSRAPIRAALLVAIAMALAPSRAEAASARVNIGAFYWFNEQGVFTLSLGVDAR